jgi:hypothetical protein
MIKDEGLWIYPDAGLCFKKQGGGFVSACQSGVEVRRRTAEEKIFK